MMKIVTVIGTRPQFIKAAAVSPKLRKHHREVIIHTGQHYDYLMSQVFFNELKIPQPDYNLGVGSVPAGWQIGRMLEKIESILKKEKPAIVLVYGDTNSTLAGALAAYLMNIPVAHIEAGLRSFDKAMPEERNRILTDSISSLCFCPTENAAKNLRREGFKNAINVGDVMYDIFLKYNKRIKSDLIKRFKLCSKNYYLATIHRQENTAVAKNLKNIITALKKLDKTVIFPLHPRTKKYLKEFNIKTADNILIVEPKGYLEMLALEKNASKILTDSGGVQKEAYFFKIPCITLRNNTEWIELIHSGWNRVVGANPMDIINAVLNEDVPNVAPAFYGDGKAGDKIVSRINNIRL